MSDVILITEDENQEVTSKTIDKLSFTGDCMRVFDIEFDTDTGTPIAAIDNDEEVYGVWIPKLWDPHPEDPWMGVVHKDVVRKGPDVYTVSVYYSRFDEPLLQNEIWEWGSVASEEPVDRDFEGKPLVNSSDESYDPPQTMCVYDATLRITRNQEQFDTVQAAQYRGAVNSDTAFNFPIGQIKIQSISARLIRIVGIAFWEVSYEFHMRTDGWIRKRLDEGFRTKEIVEMEAVYTVCREGANNTGDPLSQPVLLDGNGQKLAEGADPHFLEWEDFEKLPFSVFGFEEPQPIK